MTIDVYVLTSPFDTSTLDVYRSLISLSKRKKLRGKINIKKIMANSDAGLNLIKDYSIKETPAVIIGNTVISEGDVPIRYLYDALEDIIEEDTERTSYIY